MNSTIFSHKETSDNNGTDSNHQEKKENHSEHHVPVETLVVYFLIIALFLGMLCRQIYRKYGISSSSLIFLVGLVMSLFLYGGESLTGQAFQSVQNISIQGIFQIFLPILSFYSSFTIEWNIFRKQIKQVVFLGVPTTIINALLLSLGLKILYRDDSYLWIYSFILATILSATDAFSSVQIVKDIGMNSKFVSLLKGETLLNNAITYSMLIIAIRYQSQEYTEWWHIVLAFISLNVVSIILGIVIGFIFSFMMKKMFNDYIQVTNLTFICGFLSFFIAEHLITPYFIPVSGFMTLIALGFYMAAFGKQKINPESDHVLMTFWNYAIFAAEKVLFILVGSFCGFRLIIETTNLHMNDYLKLVGLYLFMLFIRYLSLIVSKPFLENHGYGLTNKQFTVLWNSGSLRGAISICLCLIVSENDKVFPSHFRLLLLFHVSGCVFLSLFINGLSSKPLISSLGFLLKTRSRTSIYVNFLYGYLNTLSKKKNEMMVDKFLQLSDWDQVDDLSGITDLKDKLEHLKNKHNVDIRRQENHELQSESQQQEINYNNLEADDLQFLEEARNKSILCIKGVINHLFEENQCSGDSMQLLKFCLDEDLDQCYSKMKSWVFLSNQFYQKKSMKQIESLSRIPLIGSVIKNVLLSDIGKFHDSVTTYIIAIRRTQNIIKHISLPRWIEHYMLYELGQNLILAEEYYYGYLQISYSSITKQVQTKKAALNIIEGQRSFANQKLSQGQISAKEYAKIKTILDQHQMDLEQINFDFEEEPQKQFIQNLAFFQFLNSQDINELLTQSEQINLMQNQILFQQGDQIQKFYIIIKGSATETYQNGSNVLKERKAVGSIVSYFNLFSESKKYESTLKADTDMHLISFDLKKLKKFAKLYRDLESYVYKENMKVLQKIMPVAFKEIQLMDNQQLMDLLSISYYQKLQTSEKTDFTQGGILISGKVFIFNDNDFTLKDIINKFQFRAQNGDNEKQKRYERRNLFEQDLQQECKYLEYIEGPCIVTPTENKQELDQDNERLIERYSQRVVMSIGKTVMFKFNNYDEAQKLIDIEDIVENVRQSYVRSSVNRLSRKV